MSLTPFFIIRHPEAASHVTYSTERAAIEAAQALVKRYGGIASVFSRVALVDAVPEVTR